MEPLEETRAVYDRIADEYYRQHNHRVGLADLFARFCARLPAGALVLDIGCGPGFDTTELRRRGMNAFGLDYSWGMLTSPNRFGGGAEISVPLCQGDMRRLPFAAHSYDGLWILASLLHLPREQVPGALQEFQRVLRPGGIMFLSVKGGEGAGWRQTFNRPGIDRFFTFWPADDLDGVLETAGFHLLESWEDTVNKVRWLGRLAQR